MFKFIDDDLKKRFMRLLAIPMVLLLAFLDLTANANSLPARAAGEPTVMLQGRVDARTQGEIEYNKTLFSDDPNDTYIHYTVMAAGLGANDEIMNLQAHLSLPWLEHLGGEDYKVEIVGTPSALGVQANIFETGGWSVVPDETQTEFKGGPLTLQYLGQLKAGQNPGFVLKISSYKGNTAPYDAMPEGTLMTMGGYVTYSGLTTDADPDKNPTQWETPGSWDPDSEVTLIASNLTWEHSIELPDGDNGITAVWDRYHYADYIYTLKNTSENAGANIEGFTAAFDITNTGTRPAGVIPADVNRWIYEYDADTDTVTITENPDPLDVNIGEWLRIGKPGEGGIVIYDITDEANPLGPLPYTVTGDGEILIDQKDIYVRPEIANDGPHERKYIISVPFARQGFPSPAPIEAGLITNVTYAQKQLDWSETTANNEREVTWPDYNYSYDHTTATPQVVYGYETHNTISNIKNGSNAPTENHSIDYAVHSDFNVDRVKYTYDLGDEALFSDTAVTYSYTYRQGNQNITVDKVILLSDSANTRTVENGVVTIEVDVSDISTNSSAQNFTWNRNLGLGLIDSRVSDAPDGEIPVQIDIYGTPYEVGQMDFPATLNYEELYANNTQIGDLYGETTYEYVKHTLVEAAGFEVIYPEKVYPVNKVTASPTTINHGEEATVNYTFGTNNNAAQTSETLIQLNPTTKYDTLTDITATIKKELFESVSDPADVEFFYINKNGVEQPLAYSFDPNSPTDFELTIPNESRTLIVRTGVINTPDTGTHFVTLNAKVDNGITNSFRFNSSTSTYQPPPYNSTETASSFADIAITMPEQLAPVTKVTGVYGTLETSNATNTNVSYQSEFAVKYGLGTGDVNSPDYTYTLSMANPPANSRYYAFKEIKLDDLTFTDSVTSVKFTDRNNNTVTINPGDIPVNGIITIDLLQSLNSSISDDINEIIFTGKDLQLGSERTVVIAKYGALLDMGKSQVTTARFSGNQASPYDTLPNKTHSTSNTITVFDATTKVKIEGVKQVDHTTATRGNEYDYQVYANPTSWTIPDETLDQGYKSLGGFTASFTRPTQAYGNNEQTTQFEVELPSKHFDLYYIRMREEIVDYVTSIDIYTENGVRTVTPGFSPANTSGFVRIDTAQQGAGFTHYKDPWASDVYPDDPVTKLVFNLEFNRVSETALPQLGGHHEDIIEMMGRFYSSSINPNGTALSANDRQTTLKSEDTFGETKNPQPQRRGEWHEIKRNSVPDRPVYSIVQYPFAQSRTGAHENTSKPSHTITQGYEGFYKASIWNIANQTWGTSSAGSYSHGADAYTPIRTNYDDWLQSRHPASFHDTMIYEFTYPANPRTNSSHNFDATTVKIIDTSTLKYLTSLDIYDTKGNKHSHDITGVLSSSLTITYEHDGANPVGFSGTGSNLILNLEANHYPTKFDLFFDQINGFGDKTGEISGVTPDSLGANLSELDVQIGGIVSGTNNLTGTTKLYRWPDDQEIKQPNASTKRLLMHTSSAILNGYTPKLNASVDAEFNKITPVYDYGIDGITPNESHITLSTKNTSEADIVKSEIRLVNDQHFRTKTVQIPEALFDLNGDWVAKNVQLKQGNTWLTLDLGDTATRELFVYDATSKLYTLTLDDLFSLTPDSDQLKIETFDVSYGTNHLTDTSKRVHTLHKKHVDEIRIAYESKDPETIRMWGSLALADDDEQPSQLLQQMQPLNSENKYPGDAFVTGIWVDEEPGNVHSWNSKPTFKGHGTTVSNSSYDHRSSFTVSTAVEAYQPFTNPADKNTSGVPTVFGSKTYNSGNAPVLYARHALLDLSAKHLANDYDYSTHPKHFFDDDTGTQIDMTNIVVDDTVKVLYRINNKGTKPLEDNTAGNLPVINPVMDLTVPKGLKVTKAFVVGDQSDPVMAKIGSQLTDLVYTLDATFTPDTDTFENDKAYEIHFGKEGDFETPADNVVLDYGKSLYVLVEFTATNDFISNNPQLGDTQNKTARWNAYARPGFAHHFQSYRSNSTTADNGQAINGSSNQTHKSARVAQVYNDNYRYADPKLVRTESTFDVENISGKEMHLDIKNIYNEPLHDNSNLDVYVTLDINNKNGFELTKFPEPEYPEWFKTAGKNQFEEPKVYFWNPNNSLPEGGVWILSTDYVTAADDDEAGTNSSHIHMSKINRLWIEYGEVTALDDEDNMFRAPDFKIEGIGHWQQMPSTTKTYDIVSNTEIVVTHKADGSSGVEDGEGVAEYSYTSPNASTRVYKTMAHLEFNIQAFNTFAEAEAAYNPEDSGKARGKTNYVAGDEINYRITAKNHTTYEGLNTSTAVGKAPLLEPVIYDKIPEYLEGGILATQYKNDNTFNLQDAIDAGLIVIKHLDEDGNIRTDVSLPTVTVEEVAGKDIAGAQVFNGNGAGNPTNNGQGQLSTAQPLDTNANPADEITFYVFKYEFEDAIERGEQIEIIYQINAREENLPYATYGNGKSIFAPFFGWYDNNKPVSDSAKNHSMDMASLLHDAGITGTPNHETNSSEFLRESFAWHPGSTEEKRLTNGANTMAKLDTYYDASANKELTHKAFLQERANADQNTLYINASSSTVDDSYAYATKGRVSDGAVTDSERILWAQHGMQLNRAWLYGTSQMLPDKIRTTYSRSTNWGSHDYTQPIDAANYYEHDRNLFHTEMSSINIDHQRTPYVYDDHTPAVELYEEFTVRLHSANLGDREIKSGIEYIEILPIGINPYQEDANGNLTSTLLGVEAFTGKGVAIDPSRVDVEVIQTPTSYAGYKAPAQSQEARTYEPDRHDFNSELLPYVLKVTVNAVSGEMAPMFHSPVSGHTANTDANSKYQYVDIRVRVDQELAPIEYKNNELTIWHDELFVSTVDPEEYLETYTQEYGGFHREPTRNNTDKFANDGMGQGIDVNDLYWRRSFASSPSSGGYPDYLAVEPWGMYVRGLNDKVTDAPGATKPTVVSGDQLAMRKPTLRVWSKPEKDAANYIDAAKYDSTVEDFGVNLYEEFTVHTTVENFQFETDQNYLRKNAGRVHTGTNGDIFVNAPQTIGGARGGWFEPTVTVALPHGIAPIVNGAPARHDENPSTWQNVEFIAHINTMNGDDTTERDVSDKFDLKVELISDANFGKRFVLYYTPKDPRTVDIAYGEYLTFSPKVAVVDRAKFGNDEYDLQFQQLLAFANSMRPVFNPVIPGQLSPNGSNFTTGQPPSTSGNITANDSTLAVNDRLRRDSTTTLGQNKVGERLITPTQSYLDDTVINLADKLQPYIGENEEDNWQNNASVFVSNKNIIATPRHDKSGAYGGTIINLSQPSIWNTTNVLQYPYSAESSDIPVDPTGKYWYLINVENKPIENTADRYTEYKSTGTVAHSRFLVTSYVTKYATPTEEVRLKIMVEEQDDNGDTILVEKLLKRSEFEALGYKVEKRDPNDMVLGEGNNLGEFITDIAGDDDRQRIQWIVTTPAESALGVSGNLKSGENFKLLYEVLLIDGFDENTVDEDEHWEDAKLHVDTYVSILPEDIRTDFSTGVAKDHFITQGINNVNYFEPKSDEEEAFDIDAYNGEESLYAYNTNKFKIIKPKGEVRINTLKPRLEYSNGLTGDNYYNSAEDIDYVISHAKVTGSGLKELVVETILPAKDVPESSIPKTETEFSTVLRNVSTGIWDLPLDDDAIQLLEELHPGEPDLKARMDKVFRTFVYISHEDAIDDYEDTYPSTELDANWTLLNPDGTSVLENENIVVTGNDRLDVKKIRVVVRSLDPENFRVPSETRLDIDADPDTTPGKEDVLETDPDNKNITLLPETVTDNSINIKLNALSNVNQTLMLYGAAQAWGNYISDKYVMLDDSITRLYLTPSKPVVNIFYTSKYFNRTGGVTSPFGWVANTSVNPGISPHLRFTGEYINASEDMWDVNDPQENISYKEDLLINPTVTFALPNVMKEENSYTHIPHGTIDETHPLHIDYQRNRALSAPTNLWTWHIEGPEDPDSPGTMLAPHPKSVLTLKETHAGPWPNFNKNLFTVWFEGTLQPGDRVVIDFITEVAEFTPTTSRDQLLSTTSLTNNTGLITPLNSKKNSENKLSYRIDGQDFDDDGVRNDRLIEAARELFGYASYDNFQKTKRVYSNLSETGTQAPQKSRVEQGGVFEYKLSMENTNNPSHPGYPYPIFYDVLPEEGDLFIDSNGERGSTYKPWLLADGMKLELEGANGVTYPQNAYTVYVGPIKKIGSNYEVLNDVIELGDSFSDRQNTLLALKDNTAGARANNFVPLNDIKNDEELMKEVRSILVLLQNVNASIDGEHKMNFHYKMKSPLNAPGYMQQFDAEDREVEVEAWNTFLGTKVSAGENPQESNRAGIYATEQQDHVYIGNYVWHDWNYNSLQDEGVKFTDVNGREHLSPDGSDRGINGVKVTLLTEDGFYSDRQGNRIAYSEDDPIAGAGWFQVDENGDFIIEEVFEDDQVKIHSEEGPMVKITETDFYGHHGYYTFSNIKPGTYKLLFEFPDTHDRYTATTQKVFYKNDEDPKDSNVGVGLKIFDPGVDPDVHAASGIELDKDRLHVITNEATVDLGTTDEERMSFDIGVAQKIKIGGTVFQEDQEGSQPFDGMYQAGEALLEGYNVYLKNMAGETIIDEHGQPMVTQTAADGTYVFDLLPREREYYMEITDDEDEFNYDILITPFVTNSDPFAVEKDNDGFNEKGTTVNKSNPLNLSLASIYAPENLDTKGDPKDRLNVWYGFYEKSELGVIGNRVWHDLNRDGLQTTNEPGIAGQELKLKQFYRADETDENSPWIEVTNFDSTYKNPDTNANKAVSNADGYYYFKKVPAFYTYENDDGEEVKTEARYEVYVESLVEGYTITLTNQSDPALAGDADYNSDEFDSDFYDNGTLHADGDTPGENLVTVLDYLDPENLLTSFGATDNTVDLGLVPHALSHIAGEIFIDTNKDGMKDDPNMQGAEDPEQIYTITLQVKHGEVNGEPNWVDAQHDGDGVMIEPRTNTAGTTYSVADATEYRFDNLQLINHATLEAYEYRVLVDGVPLWQELTLHRAGTDTEVDNDFDGTARSSDINYNMVTSTGYTEIVRPNTNHVNGYDTFYADYPEEYLDLGLTNLSLTFDIGDYIWYDTNDNGLQDSDDDGVPEKGAPGIEVTLNRVVKGSNPLLPLFKKLEPIATTTTDANGFYEFKDLPVADTDYDSDDFNVAYEYVVQFTTTSRQEITKFEAGNDDTINSKFQSLLMPIFVGLPRFENSVADPAHTAVTKAFTLADLDDHKLANYATGADNDKIDGGIVPHETLRSIGDTLYEDLNSNGTQDINVQGAVDEPGIPGITVNLYRFDKDANSGAGAWVSHTDDNGNSSLVTDQNGKYEFVVEVANMDKASSHYRDVEEYRVLAEVPANMRLVEGPGIDNEFEYQNSTNVNGISVTRPYSWVLTDSITLVDTRDEADQDPGYDGTYDDLRSAKDHLTADAGFNIYDTTVTIAGKMWEDENFDGIQQSTEEPIAGETVTLWEKIGSNWVNISDVSENGGKSSMVTDQDGNYFFEVAPTNYDELDAATFLKPREYLVTAQRKGWQLWSRLNEGTDPEIDSDAKSSAGTQWASDLHKGVTHSFDIFDMLQDSNGDDTDRVDVTSVRDDLFMDFGVKTHANEVKLGGVVWDDVGLDGIYDETNEDPIEGQVVTLWQWNGKTGAEGAWVEYTDLNGDTTQTTDEDGYYEFLVEPTNYEQNHGRYLEPFKYLVTIEREGYQLFSPISVNANDGIQNTIRYDEDSQWAENLHYGNSREYDISDNVGNTNKIDVSSVRDDLDDFIGFATFDTEVKIGGTVWDDVDLDGIYDENNEGAIEGQLVTLWQWDGSVGIDGEWVEYTDLNGDSTQKTGTGGRYEFLVEPTNYDQDHDRYLEPFRYLVTIEREGYQLFSPISANANDGIQNTIRYDEDSQWAENLHYGNSREYDISDNIENSEKIDVSSVKNDLNDFIGFATFDTEVKIGGTVWDDVDLDGIYDENNEDAIEGQVVTLWQWNGKTGAEGAWVEYTDLNGNATQLTQADGSYEFLVEPTNYEQDDERYLEPFRYLVTIERHGFQLFSPISANANDGIQNTIRYDEDSQWAADLHYGNSREYDISDNIGNTDKIDVSSVKNDLDDFIGFATFDTEVVIGGVVWDDVNLDGIYDTTTEDPFADQEVTLWHWVDNEWVEFEDLNGESRQLTDAEGRYEFRVPTTDYDQDSSRYLEPFRYLVTIEREGYQLFSPISQDGLVDEEDTDSDETDSDDNAGDDKNGTDGNDNSNGAEDTDDSDESEGTEDAEGAEESDGIQNTIRYESESQWAANLHYGNSREYVISDTDEETGNMLVASVRSDLDDFIGLTTFDTEVVIGGVVWDDVNLDGIYDEDAEDIFEEQEVTLWHWVDNEWVEFEDLNGESRQLTDAEGRYEFRVPTTDYDQDSSRYLEPFRYLVTIEREGYQLFSPISQDGLVGEEDADADDAEESDGIQNTIRYDSESQWAANLHYGNSREYVISDTDEDAGKMLVASVRSDLDDFIGLTTFGTETAIGGVVWDDVNLDGIYDTTTETPIVGQEVTLWQWDGREGVEGEWVEYTDLNGESRQLTDEYGSYEFLVEPTSYDQEHERYLETFRYLVTIEREGFQLFSPISEDTAETDPADSDGIQNTVRYDSGSQWAADLHYGNSREAVIGSTIGERNTGADNAETDAGAAEDAEAGTGTNTRTGSAQTGTAGGKQQMFAGAAGGSTAAKAATDHLFDVSSVSSDHGIFMGLTTLNKTVKIGGIVWDDSNRDNIRQNSEVAISFQRVTLWENVDGKWQIIADLNGNKTTSTDENGYYEFEVEATNYDQESANYLQARIYRTTLSTPVGYLLSEAAERAHTENDQTLASSEALLGETLTTGQIDIQNLLDDTELNYPLVMVDKKLEITGTDLPRMLLPILLLLSGVALFAMGRKRKKPETAT